MNKLNLKPSEIKKHEFFRRVVEFGIEILKLHNWEINLKPVRKVEFMARTKIFPNSRTCVIEYDIEMGENEISASAIHECLEIFLFPLLRKTKIIKKKEAVYTDEVEYETHGIINILVPIFQLLYEKISQKIERQNERKSEEGKQR